MRLEVLIAGLLVFVPSCAVGSIAGTRDHGMAYTVPEGNPLTFSRTDSMELFIDVPGMGSFDVLVDQRATLIVGFEPSEDGVRVTAEVREFSGRMTNPLGAPVTVTEGDVEGTLVVGVDGRGRAHVVSTPEVSGAAASIFAGEALAHELFPLLPPADVSVGASWSDTITYHFSGRDTSLDVTWAGTSTLVGDTTVAGRALTLVRTSGEVAIADDLVIGGMNMRREVAGPETGFYLWDAARRAVILHEITRDLVGEVVAEITALPLRVTVRQHSVLKLLGG